ncbi:SusC/RagA family TonB-linked outer membrane protein [Arenibacter certesii]|uniref:SusC/RagA family TonB-linked outer membrane protein n=1 Tax=Arenibacter certesii TaxID=228955 RepID=A0A918IT45_9FLAO|nr:TonB-dependent receptor [Arenibacter certesii]GGW30308.1 SusC/RagA family TonB-linked outer membrane protein [Arenibacter certesii]
MMKKSLQSLLLVLVCLAVSQGFGQDRVVTGSVVDEENFPLPGVTVQLKNTQKGAITDFDGNFTISVPDNDENILIFSYLGYARQEVALGSSNSVSVVMEDDVSALDEVVVVGYGTQKKENLTGAISQISAEDIAMRPSPDIVGTLQGLMPGLNIQVNTGDPTATPDINIRGFNSINGGGPLVMIDGIEGDIGRVNPEDIQNVTVLKDAASAAIYGARGAFGVILITTKSGKSGDMRINYTTNYGFTSPTTRTDFVSDPYVYGKTVDAAIFGYNGSSYTGYDDMDWETIRMVANGEIEPFHQKQPNGSYKFFYKTDWHDYLFKKVQPSSIHNISISGGGDKLKGYLSGRVYNRETINNIQDSDFNRYNLKSTLTFDVNDWLQLSNNTLFSREMNQEYGGFRNGYGGLWSTTTWYDMMAFYPYEIDGVPTDVGRSGNGGQGGGPAMEDGNNWRKFNTEQFTNTFRAKVTPIKNLEINFDYSNRITNTHNTYRYNPFEYLSTDRLTLTTAGVNSLGEYRWRDYYNALNVFGTYSLQLLDDHNFKLLAGYNQEDYDRDRVYAQQGGLLIRDKANLAFGTEMLNADGSALLWAVQGYFGRFNYDYKNKYLLEVNARYDGSSRFPEDSRWGFFPSISAGWQVNREEFWKPLEEVVSSLKLRGSYGELGNQSVPVNTFQSLMPMGLSSWMNHGEPLNYVSAPGPLPKVVTWETTKTLDFGVDLGFMGNKLTTTFDWYRKETEGMYLPSTPLPSVFGASEPRENLASLRNTGFELGIGYKDSFMVGGSPLAIRASGSLSNFKGVITKYDNPEGLMSSYWEGQELGQIWGYRTDGQFQSDEEAKAYQDSFDNPSQDLGDVYRYILNTVQNNEWNKLRAGDVKYLDTNGDGKIDKGDYTLENHGDLVPIGNAMPKYTFGFNLSTSWKGIDVSLAGAGVGKQNWYPTGDIYWGTYQRPYLTFLRKDLVNNAWTPESGGKYPQIYRGYASLQSRRSLYEMNDLYLENVGFLRVKNLTIGYTIPQEIMSKVNIQKLRVYFSGENLFTWRFGNLTKYIDPEQAGSAINYSNPGSAVGRADLRDYPMGKTISIGINLGL